MKKITLAAIAVIFVFTLVDFSFAANEFQTKGIVTKINGNKITIKDNKGKETSVDSSIPDIKVGESVRLYIEIEQKLDIKISKNDVEFLTKQCHFDSADIDIIPKLNRRAKLLVKACLSSRDSDCTLLEGFKQTREHVRKFTPPPEDWILPPADYNRIYITKEELSYMDKINNRIAFKKGLKVSRRIEFQKEGKVTKISGNQITINDDTGQETSVEIISPNIKVGDAIILNVNIELES